MELRKITAIVRTGCLEPVAHALQSIGVDGIIDALARPAFLDQFGGLDMMAFHRKVFPPVPGEPRSMDAVREALMIAFHDGGGMMQGGPIMSGEPGDSDRGGKR